MTLTRLTLTSTLLWCGVDLALFLGTFIGVLGYIAGFILGIVGAFFAIWLALYFRVILFQPFPPCKRGKCLSIRDYEWRYGSFYGYERWGVYWYRCKCGDQYVRVGKRFTILLSDGSTLPYKALVGFHKWGDDVGCEVSDPPQDGLPK